MIKGYSSGAVWWDAEYSIWSTKERSGLERSEHCLHMDADGRRGNREAYKRRSGPGIEPQELKELRL